MRGDVERQVPMITDPAYLCPARLPGSGAEILPAGCAQAAATLPAPSGRWVPRIGL
jgi:hypothetical protein